MVPTIPLSGLFALISNFIENMRRRKNLVSLLTGVLVEVTEDLAIGTLRTARLGVRLLDDRTAQATGTHTYGHGSGYLSPVSLYRLPQGRVRIWCLVNSVGKGLPR